MDIDIEVALNEVRIIALVLSRHPDRPDRRPRLNRTACSNPGLAKAFDMDELAGSAGLSS
jgi:hypothetical protein